MSNFTKEQVEQIKIFAHKMCSVPIKEYLLLALNEAEIFFKSEAESSNNTAKLTACQEAKSIVAALATSAEIGHQQVSFKEHKLKLVMILAAMPHDFKIETMIMPKYQKRILKEIAELIKLCQAYYMELLRAETKLKEHLNVVFGSAANQLTVNVEGMMYFVLQQKMRLGVNCYYADESGRIIDEVTEEMLGSGDTTSEPKK